MKILTPPCVTSRDSFIFGQAINFIYADTISRFHKLKGDDVDFVPFTWNNHARRTEEINPDFQTYDQHRKFSEGLMERMEDGFRSIGIDGTGNRYADTSDEEQRKVQVELSNLNTLRYLIHKDGNLLLDVPKILERTDVLKYIEAANFTPAQIKKQVLNNLKQNDVFQLTKEV